MDQDAKSIRLPFTIPRVPTGGFLEGYCEDTPDISLESYLAASKENFNRHRNDFRVEFFWKKETNLHKIAQAGIAFAIEFELEGFLEHICSLFMASTDISIWGPTGDRQFLLSHVHRRGT